MKSIMIIKFNIGVQLSLQKNQLIMLGHHRRPKTVTINSKLLSSTFLWNSTNYYAVQEVVEVLTFESVDESLKCDHSNESY